MSKELYKREQEVRNLVAEVEAISDSAERAGRDITQSEKRRCEEITGSNGLLEVLNMDIDKLKRQFRSHALAEMEPRLDQQMRQAGLTTSSQKASSIFASREQAYDVGMFYAGTLFGSRKAMRHCEDNGLISNAMSEGVNSGGGFLVPEQLESVVVELREQFGVMRREANVVAMSSDSMLVPKNAGEVSSYYVSENAAITTSDMVLSQLRLTAKKLATLTAVSSELNEDSVLSMADMLTRSIAYSFSLKEDQAGFLGDATSTYGGIVGLANALNAGATYTATSRTTFGALTLADFESCMGGAKLWVGSKPKWYISQQGWANSMQRLLDSAGGNSLISLAMGAQKTFLGFDVVISQVLPSTLTGTTGTLACFFGDLKGGVLFGSRRGINLGVDSSLYFNQDALAVRATERFDINVHDRGDATNAGGIVKMIFG